MYILSMSIEQFFNYIADYFTAIVNFLEFLSSLPNLLINMFNSFPAFIRMGITVIFSMLVIALTVRIYRYIRG